MNTPSYKSAIKVIVPLIIGGLFFASLAWKSDPKHLIRQMELDSAFIEQCTIAVSADLNFSNVECFSHTGAIGTVFIRGTVKSEDELMNLRKQILTLPPTTNLSWEVRVVAEAKVPSAAPTASTQVK